ncbi:tRNA methyltransferase 13 [Cricetulus griseus]
MEGPAPTSHAASGVPAEGRCSYFVEKKRRFCRMVAAAGKRFCGEHAGAAEGENARKRILCPLDPKHTVYEDQLAKHLKKCNSREKPKPDFFIQDINAGLKDEMENPEQLVPFSSLSEEQLENLIKKLRKASEDRIPVLQEGRLPVVGIGKHLCGVATDLALRCLVETYAASFEERNEEPLAKRVKNDKTEKESNILFKEGNEKNIPEMWTPVAGIVIALCCHHRCDWRHYVGKEYFKALGLGAVDFYYFQRMSSWATCGMRRTSLEASDITTKRKDDQNSDNDEHDDGGDRLTDGSTDGVPGILTAEEKKNIGHLCKLLIDQGRLQYLQQKGFSPALQYYTDPSVSLENVLLTAVPAHLSSQEATH